jgi:7,8-dihydro-6-hydroxymethylpterin-pyrophosphokinase (HPPK)
MRGRTLGNTLRWSDSTNSISRPKCICLFDLNSSQFRPHWATTRTNRHRQRHAGTTLLLPVLRGYAKSVHDVKASAVELHKKPFHSLAISPSKMDGVSAGKPICSQNGVMHRAMIALGSNIGDRVSMIEQACERMSRRGIRIKATSALYESAPMYVTDQNLFYNGVCEVGCSISRF